LLTLKDIDENIEVIDKYKKKLLDDPDAAARNLADVIKELSLTCEALDSELTNYLGVWFIEDDMHGIVENRRILIGLEGGKSRIRMAEARGHCSKIKVIYDRNLKRWFKRVFQGDEYQQMENLFDKLSYCDSWILKLTEELANWLEDRANHILDLVSQKKYLDANNEIESDRKEQLPQRLHLSKVMVSLYTLQAEFIELSGAL
jgi:hypothetical protein